MLVNTLAKNEPTSETGDVKSNGEIEGLKVSIEDKVFKIELNRPQKYNAITWEMYEGLIKALETASTDRTTRITVLTGNFSFESFRQLYTHHNKNLRQFVLRFQALESTTVAEMIYQIFHASNLLKMQSALQRKAPTF